MVKELIGTHLIHFFISKCVYNKIIKIQVFALIILNKIIIIMKFRFTLYNENMRLYKDELKEDIKKKKLL